MICCDSPNSLLSSVLLFAFYGRKSRHRLSNLPDEGQRGDLRGAGFSLQGMCSQQTLSATVMQNKSLKDRVEWNTGLMGTSHTFVCEVGKYWPNVPRNVLQVWVMILGLAERQASFQTTATIREKKQCSACSQSRETPFLIGVRCCSLMWCVFQARKQHDRASQPDSERKVISELNVWGKLFQNLWAFIAGEVVLTFCESWRPAWEGPPSTVCVVCGVCVDEGRKQIAVHHTKDKHVHLRHHFTPLGDYQSNNPWVLIGF